MCLSLILNSYKMGKRKREQAFNPELGDVCGACGKWFETIQGVMAHQSNSRGCAWYKKGKLKDVFSPPEEEDGIQVSKATTVNAVNRILESDMDASQGGSSTRLVLP